jgi:tetrahydromethanopterin S-methyltransferase subunit B
MEYDNFKIITEKIKELEEAINKIIESMEEKE